MLPGSHGPYVSLTSLVRDHDDSMADQIFSSSDGQDWLFNSLSNMRNGLQFLKNGLISSCEMNAATVVASKHEGRSAVLSRCSELPAAGYKNVLMNTGYGHSTLFGPAPRSVLSRFNTNLIGKVLCSLRRRPLTVRVSRERASKIPYGICPFLLRPKNVSNLRLFSTFLPFLFPIPGER